jgi:cell filamentation protein
MTPSDRYDTSHLSEDQFESGSDGLVLKNLMGITNRDDVEIAETAELWFAEGELVKQIKEDQTFTAIDICSIHKLWLGKIYPWAGQYRQVNISKDNFGFAMARVIPMMMATFENEQLAKYTPCLFEDHDDLAIALAEVHVELMLIHPFREGNGRLGRLLATLMALQAGLPPLDFSEMAGHLKEKYFEAVRFGLDKNYLPMQEMFSLVIKKTLWQNQ